MSDIQEDRWFLTSILKNRLFQAASALGVALGILGFFISLPPVSELVFGKRVSLTLDVLNQIPVFTVRQPVPGLSVQLNSQDLTLTKRDLLAVRLRIRNNGGISVNERNTTEKDPLGFSVSGGQVVRLYGINATSEHLRKLALPKRVNNTFTLPPGLIIDPGDYIQFDLLVVRPISSKLSFFSVGKVEGLKTIEVGRPDIAKPSENIASIAWSGTFLIQILRTATYPFIAVAIIAAGIAFAVKVSSFFAKRKRKRRDRYAAEVSPYWSHDNPKIRALVPALYLGLGLERLKVVLNSESRSERLDRINEFDQRHNISDTDTETEVLSDFEAGKAIESWLKQSEHLLFSAEDLLVKLGLFNVLARACDHELSAAIGRYAAILSNNISETDLRKAEPAGGEEVDTYIRFNENMMKTYSPHTDLFKGGGAE
ncbi:hypothetical protein [Sphingomonas azotifigens]|uniref:hypothetical protein n=1 Tax=Sphingomonas azotifigens TaxID=330920 RepID=UPI00111C5EEC|nr:hypothetical protein [Sphingomonas azotifigens]